MTVGLIRFDFKPFEKLAHFGNQGNGSARPIFHSGCCIPAHQNFIARKSASVAKPGTERIRV